MDDNYHNTVKTMEAQNVNRDYIVGWMGGYLENPPREEQRLNEAYDAGYEDGKNKVSDAFSKWVNA